MNNSEDRYRTIIDAIPAMARSGRPDGSVEFLNRRWLDYTGFSLDDALAWGWKAAVHPEDLDPLTDRWRALLASGQAGEIEARLRRYDGEYRWFLFRAEIKLGFANRFSPSFLKAMLNVKEWSGPS